MHVKSAKVGSIIATIMPEGTNPKEEFEKHKANNPKTYEKHPLELHPWVAPPFFAPDLFAVTAHLCKVGGVLTYFNPSPYDTNSSLCEFKIGEIDRREADDAAAKWRKTGRFPELCQGLWAFLLECWDQDINPGHYDCKDGTAAPWWKPSLALAMIADMACARIFRNKFDYKSAFENVDEEPFELAIKDVFFVAKKKAKEENADFRPPPSLTWMIDTSLACVLPKVRVSPVGATIRNMSRNLALLPGKGEVRCLWHNLSSKAIPSEDNNALDILLIPEPRALDATDFEPEPNLDRDNAELQKNKWRWDNFELKQNWISTPEKRQKFIDQCVGLLKQAKTQSRNVNAVVLPEYAVDYELFVSLCDELKAVEPLLEFAISGSSSNCDGGQGNIVLTRVWDNKDAPEYYLTDSRRKHHRWRMNRSQVETYALSSSLNPKIENWWEKTALGRRELYFHRFRKASVFSVLICEELARSDPCHEILRSVAPNLIFALLLDGPQIRNRWPAQYASNLADDPGSSVLTFTSYGLIKRSNDQGKHGPNHCVAMWKDDSGKIVEIQMPQGEGPRGILLSLWPEHVRDITITGKRSEERAWRYASHIPIVLGKS